MSCQTGTRSRPRRATLAHAAHKSLCDRPHAGGIAFALPSNAMRYDLEGEVLRAAVALRQRDGDFPFLLDSLRELIASKPARFPRACHPLVAPSVAALVERLVADGLLERDGETLSMTEAAHAYLAHEPQHLGAPPHSVVAAHLPSSAATSGLPRGRPAAE